MTKFYLAVLLSGLVSSSVVAQSPSPTTNQSIQAGVDYMSLDFPDDLGIRYTLRYARHLANDRLLLAATGGYLLTDKLVVEKNGQRVFGNKRERLTADLAILVDFVKNSQHALRAGGGLSGWVRQDNVVTSIDYQFDTSRGAVITTATAVQREHVSALNLGWHATAEYEYRFPNRITASGRFLLANLGKAGISSVAGVAVGYRF